MPGRTCPYGNFPSAEPGGLSRATTARHRRGRHPDRRRGGRGRPHHAPGRQRAGHRHHVAVQLRTGQEPPDPAHVRPARGRVHLPLRDAGRQAPGDRRTGPAGPRYRAASPVAAGAAPPAPSTGPERPALPGLLPGAAGQFRARYRGEDGGHFADQRVCHHVRRHAGRTGERAGTGSSAQERAAAPVQALARAAASGQYPHLAAALAAAGPARGEDDVFESAIMRLIDVARPNDHAKRPIR